MSYNNNCIIIITEEEIDRAAREFMETFERALGTVFIADVLIFRFPAIAYLFNIGA